MTSSSMADFGAPNNLAPEPERTSILAILSLVTSLICCVPGLSILGVFLGIGSMVAIGGSNGRVGGKGLAIAGILLGVLVTIGHGAIGIGAASAWKEVQGAMTQMDPAIRGMDTGDYTAARTMFAPSVTVTDEQFDAFRQAYQADYGPLGAQVIDLVEWASSFGTSSGAFQNYQGSAMIPMVYDTTNGRITFIMVVRQSDLQNANPGQNPFLGAVSQIGVQRPDGSLLELLP